MSIITDYQAADLLVTAIEGGSNYWYDIIDMQVPDVLATPWGKDVYTPNYIAYPFSAGGAIIITDRELERDEQKKFTLDRQAIERGKKLIETGDPQILSDVITENSDAETGDIFLQLCLFGEVIYG